VELSNQEAEVVRFIRSFIQTNSRLPTLRELRDGVDLPTVLRARTLLELLRQRGIVFDPGNTA